MKNGEFASAAVSLRRAVLTVLMLFGAVANSSFFILQSSFSQTQHGIASYYSKKATGRKTSSGERLHHDSLTCAHRTYPFGTLLKVFNPANNTEVVVKVNDRGPFGRGRIIDLSWGAAKALGILSQGIAPVVVERIGSAKAPLRDTTRISTPEFYLAFPKTDSLLKPVWQRQTTNEQLRLRLPSSSSQR